MTVDYDEFSPELATPSTQEAMDILGDLFQQYDPPLDRFQWPVESMRWNELVYSIFATVGSERSARTAARALSQLNLLEIDKLAAVTDPPAPTDRGRTIRAILMEAGFEKTDADQALSAIVEAARMVQTDLDGKVQRALRLAGRAMREEIKARFHFDALDEETASRAITRWLQTVLNLPVYLETESGRAFCEEMDLTTEELIAAADGLDINVAIVDELLERWYEGKGDQGGLETGASTSGEPVGAVPGE